MNWLQFFFWITGIYTIYYLVVILAEVLGKKRNQAGAALSRELTFEEPVTAQQVAPLAPEKNDPEAETPSNVTLQRTKKVAQPESVGTGGVPVDNIFLLARAEVIQYTAKVAF
ncbi:hypothetical protein ABDD95_07425 [Mucilaginibacter sp. PAMB04274]|uniref:hypothetical protein n=1 Tax=Mucilaginibacter sp. PAMB04274 TaxID=3138568 RepID=UPI0031F62B8A